MLTKVLVVDDDEDILDAIGLTLETAGYTVATLTKSSRIFDMISSFSPNIIILDVLMSGSDGREICQQLKHMNDFKHIPIIMTSAHPSAAQSSIRFGADDFLPKPFDIKDLLAKVTQFEP